MMLKRFQIFKSGSGPGRNFGARQLCTLNCQKIKYPIGIWKN